MAKGVAVWRGIAIGAILACAILVGLLVFVHPPSTSSLVWSAEEQQALLEEAKGLGLGVGVQAPDFTLATTEGDSVRLLTLAGRRVVLLFVSPTCPYCRELEGRLAQLQPPTGGEVVLVCGGKQTEAQQVKEEHGLPFPVLVDSAQQVSQAYRIRSVPTVYLLDEQGKVVAGNRGLFGSWRLVQRGMSGP